MSPGFLRIGRPYFDILAKLSKTKTYRPRRIAISELAKFGGEAIPLLIEIAGDPNDDVVSAAITELGGLRATEAVPPIMRAMIEDHDRKSHIVRRAAMKALIEIGDKSIDQQLIAATKHQDFPVRATAAEVLTKLCGAAAIPVLANLLSDIDGGRVAAKLLDDIRTPDALDLIREYRREHPLASGESPWLSIDKEAARPKSGEGYS